MRSFWPGLPIGIVSGLLLILGFRMVWPEPVAFAAGLFVMFAVFLSIGLFREVPGAREFPGTGILTVLGGSGSGCGVMPGIQLRVKPRSAFTPLTHWPFRESLSWDEVGVPP